MELLAEVLGMEEGLKGRALRGEVKGRLEHACNGCCGMMKEETLLSLNVRLGKMVEAEARKQ